MDASARRRRRRTQIESRRARPVRVDEQAGPEDELANVLHAGIDVTADVVRVVRLELRRAVRRAAQDPVAEPGGKTLDLILDPPCHIDRRASRDVAVGPRGRSSCGRAGVVPRAVLDAQHERAIRVAAPGDGLFGRRDLGDRAAQVDRRRPAQLVGPPRDRAVERPVELEDPRAVAEPLVDPAGPRGQAVARDPDGGARRRVEDDRPRRRQLRQVRDASTRLDRPAEGAQLGGQPFGNGRRAATDHRPADGMGVEPEDEPERRGQRPVKIDHRMSRQAAEQGAGRLLAKGQPRERRRGKQRGHAEPGEGERMSRRVEHRSEELPAEMVGVGHERPEQPAPGRPVPPEGSRRVVN
jgi:hypothetical protein